MMHPLFDQMSLKYTNVVFIRVDSDQNRELAGQYNVSGLPTFVLVFHGDEVDRVVGADPNTLESKIQQYANSVATFKGTGMSLGGSGVRDAQSIREMRLKNFICRETDAAVRDNLLTMGFSAANVEKA